MRLPFASKRSEQPTKNVGQPSSKSLKEDAAEHDEDHDEKVQDDGDGKEKDSELGRGDELLKEKGAGNGGKSGRMDDLRARQLDTGDIKYIYRKKWWQVW